MIQNYIDITIWILYPNFSKKNVLWSCESIQWSSLAIKKISNEFGFL